MLCTHSILAAQVKHPEHIMAKQIHTIFFNTLIVFVPIHITPPFAACGACRSAESEAGLGNANKGLTKMLIWRDNFRRSSSKSTFAFRSEFARVRVRSRYPQFPPHVEMHGLCQDSQMPAGEIFTPFLTFPEGSRVAGVFGR
jgi:hypothetical protein